MCLSFKKTEATTEKNSAMETGDHSTNGASSKSHKSRVNFRFFYFILIAVGIVGRFDIQAQNVVSWKEIIDGIGYILWDTNEATVRTLYDGYNESELYKGDIVIPDKVSYKGIKYTVTEIGGGAFANCPELHSVVMPNTVKKIGSYAFEDCQNYNSLKSVTLSNTLEEIDDDAFMGCGALKELNLPNSLKRIGNDAFAWFTLNSITIPDSVEHIGAYLFRDATIRSILIAADNPYFSAKDNAIYNKDYTTLISCPPNRASFATPLKEDFVIPNTVKKIEKFAFAWSLYSSVTIPESVEEIRDGTFAGSGPSIAKINLNSNNKFFKIIDDALYDKDITALIYYFKGWESRGTINTDRMNVTVPNTVTRIYGGAFCGGGSNESRIASISLPKSLEYIGYGAFSYCESFKEIYSYNPIPPQTIIYEGLALSSHFNAVEDCKLYVPKGSKAAYASADGWDEFKTIIEMAPTSVDKIQKDIVLYAISNGIVIESAETVPVTIYSVSGQKVYESTIQGSKQISLNKGIYIVQTGQTARKIIVN